MLKRLASMYFEQGKFEQSIQTYRRLIRENPNSQKAPEYQNEIILSYKKIDRKKETMAEIEVLRTQYGRDSGWARANASNPDAIQQAKGFLERNLRTVAKNYQIEAEKLRRGKMAEDAYSHAEQAYAVYLEQFPDGSNTYDMRYSYAELLKELKKFDMAYEEYIKVVKMNPNGAQSLHCSNNAVYSAEAMIKREDEAGRGPQKAGAKDLTLIPLIEWEEKFLAAALLFDQYYAEASSDSKKENRSFIYKSAKIYYNHNMLEEADECFQRVIAMDQCSKDAAFSANLIMDKYTLKGDTAGLKKSAKAYLTQAESAKAACGSKKGLGSTAFRTETAEIYEGTSFRLISETLYAVCPKVEGSDWTCADKEAGATSAGWSAEVTAAKAYWDFWEEFGNEAKSTSPAALGQAAYHAFNTDQLAFSMQARHTLIDNFPKSEFFNDNIYLLGEGYESIADFGKSADFYEQYFGLTKEEGCPEVADGEKDTCRSKAAIGLAGTFRKAAGDYEQAIANYNAFIKTFPKDAQLTRLQLGIAEIYFENERWSAAAKAYYDLFTKPPSDLSMDRVFECRMQYGKAVEAQSKDASKHWRYTLQEYERAVKAKEELAKAHGYAAELMYKQIQPELEKYMVLDISGPGPGRASESYINNVIKGQLKKKYTAANKLDAELKKIYMLQGGEWSLAALTDLGRVWENFGQTLVDSYIPAYLTESQAELYMLGLEDKAFPQREKAANFYQEAIERAFASFLYTPQTEFAVQRLGELRPDDFPVLEEELIEPRYTTRSELQITYEKRP
jgi:tetratricopeptide (TPR) repeat protein